MDWTGSLPNETYPFHPIFLPTFIKRSFRFIHFPIPGRTFLKKIKNLCPNCLCLLPITYRGFVSSAIPTHIHPRSFSFIHFLIPGVDIILKTKLKLVPKLSVYYLLLIVGFFIHYSYPFSSTFPSVSSTFPVLGT